MVGSLRGRGDHDGWHDSGRLGFLEGRPEGVFRGGDSQADAAVSDWIPVTGGRTYRLSGWLWRVSGADNVYLDFNDGNAIGTNFGDRQALSTATNQWQLKSATVTVPAGTQQIKVRCVRDGANLGNGYCDGISWRDCRRGASRGDSRRVGLALGAGELALQKGPGEAPVADDGRLGYAHGRRCLVEGEAAEVAQLHDPGPSGVFFLQALESLVNRQQSGPEGSPR